VNLSIFSIPNLSQFKGLADVKSTKTGKIHILYAISPGRMITDLSGSHCIF